MKIFQNLQIAVGALGRHRLRSSLTILSISVAVTAVVCMVSIGNGTREQVSDQIRSLGTNLLIVTPNIQGTSSNRSGARHALTERDAGLISSQINEAQYAAPVKTQSGRVVAGKRSWATLVGGIKSDYLRAREWSVVSGRNFTDDELGAGAKVCIIGDAIKVALFGGANPVGQSLRIGEVPFLIVGVLGKKGQGAMGRNQDDVVFVPLSAAKRRLPGLRGGARDAVDFIVIKMKEVSALGIVEQKVSALLRQTHQLRDNEANDFYIQDPAEALDAQRGAMRTLSFLLIAVASVSLIVGGISIMNIMLVSVTERTREIGLRMAVGARRRDIRSQFLMEAALLSALGAAIGATCGVAASHILASYAQWPVQLGAWAIFSVCSLSILIGTLFGYYPAHQASRLDPMRALRYE